jgi:hypothetical protein
LAEEIAAEVAEAEAEALDESAAVETVAEPEGPPRFACPCCSYLTLAVEPPGTFAHCEVCWWEDDPVQFADPGYEGGANAPSLSQARAFFKEIRVSDPHFKGNGRKPRTEEYPPQSR